MEDMSSKVGIERLDLDNYSSWVVRIKCLLVSKGLWKPTQEATADLELDAKSLAVIGMTLSTQHLAQQSLIVRLPRRLGTHSLPCSSPRARLGGCS